MYPTPRLRWIERTVFFKTNQLTIPDGLEIVGKKQETVLQQWYAYDIEYPIAKGEWKDVPLEKEND